MPWDPDQYHKFQAERFAPFEDLSKLVKPRAGLSVVDLGCGTGELTRRLADMLPESDVVGIDSSPEMLSKAAKQARPGLRFEEGNIRTVSGSWDVVFSHAAIQWVEDHEALIPRLLGLVRPGGQLVVQEPSNQAHVTHQLILQVANEEPFRSALGGWTRTAPVLPIERYAEMFYEQGCPEQTVFEKVYPHVLPDADGLADWTSGTALVPYFERLDEPMRERFMQRYRELLRAHFPQTPVFYGFRRILFAATVPTQF